MDGRTQVDVTTMLRAWQRGDKEALEQIAPVIHQELRRLAVFHLRGERKEHTLSPTALISEVYLRLLGGARIELRERAHFFRIASRNMRQILVDHARKRCAGKRKDGEHLVELDETIVARDQPWELVMLDDALEKLENEHERQAKVVELHYFGGLTHEEIAEMCEVHVNTVARDLRFAEAWLRRRMSTPV